MVRSIEGHGLVMTRYPPSLGLVGRPSLVTTSAAMPGNALVADPGLVGVAPGSGVMRIEPVSVCHQVSTIGQRLLPMTWWFDIGRDVVVERLRLADLAHHVLPIGDGLRRRAPGQRHAAPHLERRDVD